MMSAVGRGGIRRSAGWLERGGERGGRTFCDVLDLALVAEALREPPTARTGRVLIHDQMQLAGGWYDGERGRACWAAAGRGAGGVCGGDGQSSCGDGGQDADERARVAGVRTVAGSIKRVSEAQATAAQTHSPGSQCAPASLLTRVWPLPAPSLFPAPAASAPSSRLCPRRPRRPPPLRTLRHHDRTHRWQAPEALLARHHHLPRPRRQRRLRLLVSSRFSRLARHASSPLLLQVRCPPPAR